MFDAWSLPADCIHVNQHVAGSPCCPLSVHAEEEMEAQNTVATWVGYSQTVFCKITCTLLIQLFRNSHDSSLEGPLQRKS